MGSRSKNKRQTAKDFVRPKQRLSNGLVIEFKWTLGGMLWVEEKYGKPFEEVDFGEGGIRTLVDLLTGLAIGSNPDMPVEEIRSKICRIEQDEVEQLAGKLQQVQDVPGAQAETKNSKRPAAKKRGSK